MCPLGGFIGYRHNETRDFFVRKFRTIHSDVEEEPKLIPLTGEHMALITAKTEDDAHPDSRVRGFWVRGQSAFFDNKVIYLNAPTHRHTPVQTVLRNAEKAKMRSYNQRIREVDHGSFSPLVFSSSGTPGPQTAIVVKKLASDISEKYKEKYSKVMGLIRCELAFCLLRNALMCLRGTRTLRREDQGERVPTDLVLHAANIDH
jgi:hypothetical protein